MNSGQYEHCILCERRCGINRELTSGYCKMPSGLYVSRASLHHWEEPPISGTCGSGTIFFTGCSLSCVFCQNRKISREGFGKEITIEKLSDIMLGLQENGAHNINLVTPTHYVPSIIDALNIAKSKGLKVPIVYNTGSYDTAETIRSLKGKIDVYLPDMKYYLEKTAAAYSNSKNYPEVSRLAISEMVKQSGPCKFNNEGIIVRGTIVRVLLLPGHVAEAKLILKYLHDTYGDEIYVSLMNQYTPINGMKSPLNRKVTQEEYRQLVSYAEKIGLKNGFIQEFGSASEKFIPEFDLSGV